MVEQLDKNKKMNDFLRFDNNYIKRKLLKALTDNVITLTEFKMAIKAKIPWAVKFIYEMTPEEIRHKEMLNKILVKIGIEGHVIGIAFENEINKNI